MVNLIPTLLVVLLNIHFLVQSAEIILNASRLLTNENDIQRNDGPLVASPSNKYSNTFPESLALKVPSKISHPSVSLQSISLNLFMQLVAGTSSSGYSGDNGPATSAQMKCIIPWVDSGGNIFISDGSNYRIRKVSPAGIITTFGGTGTQATAGTIGPITSVSFSAPWSIVGDTGGTFLYISDQWYVWKYLLSTGIASVSVGISSQGFSGDNGPASLAQLNNPTGLWLTTSGDLYIADFCNHIIRKVSSSGIIIRVAGSGCTGGCISGSFPGDNNPAPSSNLNTPSGVFMDTHGRLFIADTSNNRIRLVDTNNIITTFAGTGSASPFNGDNIPAISANIYNPYDVKGDSLGNIYIADIGNCVVRIVDTVGIISILFGTVGSCGFSAGISSRSSSINPPYGIWLDSLSNIYFSDYNSIHRSITVSSPTSQPSGQPTTQPSQQPTSSPTYHLRSFDNFFMQLVAGTGTSGFSGDNGPATSAQIRAVIPWVDTSGNIYLPDRDNFRIRKVDLAGIITTFGGTGTRSTAGATGLISSVSFSIPCSVVGDTAGTVLYISDEQYVWKYLFSSDIVSVFAQTHGFGRGFSGDNGPATSAQLGQPLGLWLTTSDVLYIADFDNNRIRMVSSGIITTAVGSGDSAGFSGDAGPATTALLKLPRGVYADTNGRLFVADCGNGRIRLVDTNNIIATFAGTGNASPFNGDNILALSANINNPRDVKGDSLGHIYIADFNNCIIRMVDTSGIISTIFGSPGFCGVSDGISSRTSRINSPVGIWLDSLSNIYFSDFNSIHRGSIISPTSQPSTVPSSQPSLQPTTLPTFHPRSFDNIFMQLVAGANSEGNTGDDGPVPPVQRKFVLLAFG
jgi:sugar lactone lactonase YvrE